VDTPINAVLATQHRGLSNYLRERGIQFSEFKIGSFLFQLAHLTRASLSWNEIWSTPQGRDVPNCRVVVFAIFDRGEPFPVTVESRFFKPEDVRHLVGVQAAGRSGCRAKNANDGGDRGFLESKSLPVASFNCLR